MVVADGVIELDPGMVRSTGWRARRQGSCERELDTGRTYQTDPSAHTYRRRPRAAEVSHVGRATLTRRASARSPPGTANAYKMASASPITQAK